MKFQFESIGEFFAMAGHGPYVWGCYLVTAAVLLYLVVSPLRRQKRFMQEQKRLQRIQERNASVAASSNQ